MSDPVRMCAGCRQRRPQAELLRLRRRPDGQVIPAHGWPRGASGRSVYLCPRRACLDLATRRGGIVRGLARKGQQSRVVRIEPADSWRRLRAAVAQERDVWTRTGARPARLHAANALCVALACEEGGA